jgi:hypothetical protein
MSLELSDIQNLFRKVCKQPIYEFPKPREVLHAPDKQGVYVIINSKNRVVHVGRSPAQNMEYINDLKIIFTAALPLHIITFPEKEANYETATDTGIWKLKIQGKEHY